MIKTYSLKVQLKSFSSTVWVTCAHSNDSKLTMFVANYSDYWFKVSFALFTLHIQAVLAQFVKSAYAVSVTSVNTIRNVW